VLEENYLALTLQRGFFCAKFTQDPFPVPGVQDPSHSTARSARSIDYAPRYDHAIIMLRGEIKLTAGTTLAHSL
jgi:hypothetical protein